MTNDLVPGSCNATETIEHLDFEPTCDSRWHETTGTTADADFVCLTHRICECRPAMRMFCSGCMAKAWTIGRTKHVYCAECGAVSDGLHPWVLYADALR